MTTTESIQQLYVAYFNRPADAGGLAYWLDVISKGNPLSVVSTAFSNEPEYKTAFAGMDSDHIIAQIYNNLFNRLPDAGGLTYWSQLLTAGTLSISHIVADISDSALNSTIAVNPDRDAVQNKIAAAVAFTDYLNTDVALRLAYTTATVQIAKDYIHNVTDDASLATATAGLSLTTSEMVVGSVPVASTTALTTGLDTINGTAGNDVFVAIIDGTTDAIKTTLTPLDSINGAGGTDTLSLNILNGSGLAGTSVATLPAVTMTGVETVNLRSAVGVAADLSTWSGVTTINVTQIAKDIDTDGIGADTNVDSLNLTAGATADVNVVTKAVGDAITVDGGKNVNVTLTDVVTTTDTVVIGGGATQAKGAVTVSITGAAAVGDATLSTVDVTGGTTISVTQAATSSAAAAATDTTGFAITQGGVTVTGNTATTAVTVKQDASVATVAAVDAVAAKAATQDVTFAAMAKDETVTLDFGTGTLTFTANKALTAAEAASAFANLATGSLQGKAAASLGIYTDVAGGVTNGWTSGAVTTVSATAAKVTFTSATAVAATGTIADGVGDVTAVAGAISGDAVGATAAKTGVLGVANGTVDVTDANGTIKTITIDGYDSSTTTTTTVLETLNLSNSGLTFDVAGQVTAAADIVVADTAATLALNLEKVGFSGYYAGDASTTTAAATVTLTTAPDTLNVKSTGNNYLTLSADATKTLNVSGTGLLDAGTTTLGALVAVKVTETAGLTLDATPAATITSVDTTGTTGTVTVSIQGNLATYAGGAGADIVTVTNASTAISKAIDLGAGDDLLDLSTTLAIDPTVELKGGAGTDTLGLSAAAAVARTGGVTFQDKITSFERLGVDVVGANSTVNLDNLDDINYVITNGAGGDFGLVLDKMLAGATVQLNGDHSASVTQAGVEVKLADVAGLTDVVNLITTADTGINIGTVKVAGVETINISATDTDTTTTAAGADNVSSNSLTLAADKAATIKVSGAGNLTLTLDTPTTAVTLIDGSTATGKLVVATLASDLGATTVKGGSAADTLTAQGANDVLLGGAGKDILKVVGSIASAVSLTGGDGVDSFDVSGFLAANAGAAVTITDLVKGETIKFVSDADANFASSKVTLIAEATFDSYVTEAAKAADAASAGTHGIAWFQFNGNTFIVQDVDGDAAFVNGSDIVVKLTGLVDLSASSFNEVGQGTLMFL